MNYRNVLVSLVIATTLVGGCGESARKIPSGTESGSIDDPVTTLAQRQDASTEGPSPTGPETTADSRTTVLVPDSRAEISVEDARLVPPQSLTRRPYVDNCSLLLDPGWRGSCEVAEGPLGTVAGIVEQRENDQGRFDERALVYERESGDWTLALRTTRVVDPGSGGATRVTVSDLMKDNVPKLVFTFRNPIDPLGGGRDNITTVDVVEETGDVVVHRDLNQGVAQPFDGGGLETWGRKGETVTFVHEVVQYREGGWRVTSSEDVPISEVPQVSADSQLF